MNLNGKVLAIRYLDFIDDKQQAVKGYQVFCSAETDQPGWTKNVELLKCWVSDGSDLAGYAASLLPGDDVIIGFSRRGKPRLVNPA